jgi:hypothetical protein
MAAVNLALTGAALGASLVGLCALICGAELGVRFSYPLGLSLGGLMGPLACGLLLWGGMRVDGGVFMATWLAGIILLGAFGGKVVATSIRGYHGRSRFWAVVGIISMLLVGWRSMDSLEEGLIRSDEFVVCMLALAICGGSLGAMVGAIIDSLSRRSVRKK